MKVQRMSVIYYTILLLESTIATLDINRTNEKKNYYIINIQLLKETAATRSSSITYFEDAEENQKIIKNKTSRS